MLVGKEAYCDYQTIQEAVAALDRESSDVTASLYILSGVYEEAIRIDRSNLRIVGIGQVEITMNRYAKEKNGRGEDIGTFATSTLFLGGSRLILENLVISNTAGQGEDIGQAVAVSAHCDEAVFRYCTFKGYQDTLFTGPLPPAPKQGTSFGGLPIRRHHDRYRQLYQHCRIEGTVDYIFGGATAYFDRCEIRSLCRQGQGPGYITAASTPSGEAYGYVFNECYLTAEPGATAVYLGRPWRSHAKTDFVNCRMGAHIHPAGWHDWDNEANRRTVRYREYDGRTAAAVREQRVPWAVCAEKGKEDLDVRSVFAGTDFWMAFMD
ncbi:pectin methylesterase [Paenibacillus sp. HJL G12]|uniref:Pectinesterase n=1 Tax=Paenibacillus dendrobii TaxID=2691084 RepID=A0A7X3IIB4_9BACL|nr:pectinesterase family protein [Paenibacillus dendrobii]MWV43891.1 pectin methylesterase [Paenibacillus dendrobii]